MSSFEISSGVIELAAPDSEMTLGARTGDLDVAKTTTGEDFGRQLQVANRDAKQSVNGDTRTTQSVERKDNHDAQDETETESIDNSIDRQDGTRQASKRDVSIPDSGEPPKDQSRLENFPAEESDHNQLGLVQLAAEGAGNAPHNNLNESATDAPGVFLIGSDTTRPSAQTGANPPPGNKGMGDLIEGVTYDVMAPEDIQKQRSLSHDEVNRGSKQIEAGVNLGRASRAPVDGEQLLQVGQLLPHSGGGSPVLDGNGLPILNYVNWESLAENKKRSGELKNNSLIALETKSSYAPQSKKSPAVLHAAATLATTKDTLDVPAGTTLSEHSEQTLAALATKKTASLTDSPNMSLTSSLVSGQALSAESARPLLDTPAQLTRASLVLHTPVGQPGWDAELGSRVRWLADRGNSLAEIRLNPPELGSLTIRVSNDGERTSVTFFAQNPLARELLEAALPKLQAMFDQGDLKLADAEVSEHPLGYHAEGSGDDSVAEDSDGAADLDMGNTLENNAANANINNLSAVDYYV